MRFLWLALIVGRARTLWAPYHTNTYNMRSKNNDFAPTTTWDRQPQVIITISGLRKTTSWLSVAPLRFASSSSSPLISLSRSILLCLLSQLLFLSAHSSMSADDLAFMSRGVPLMKRSLYDPNLQTFACLDGSRVIPVRQVNDDYCDCKDGSDEPGTSACPQVCQ